MTDRTITTKSGDGPERRADCFRQPKANIPGNGKTVQEIQREMKIKMNRDRLAAAIGSVKDVAANTGLEIVRNFKVETVGMEKVRITATDLDMTVSTDVPCSVDEEGATTVRAAMLAQIVGALPTGTPLEFASDEKSVEQATLVGGEAKFRLATLPVGEFPVMAAIEDGLSMRFGAADLRGALRKVSCAASMDGIAMKSLASVCIQGRDGVANVVATDGRRLSCVTLPKSADGVPDFEMLLPLSSVKCLTRILAGDGDVEASLRAGSQARFSADGWAFQTRLMDDVYPGWRAVIPAEDSGRATLARADFEDAIRQCAATSPTENAHIRLSAKDGYLDMRSGTVDGTASSSVTVPAKTDGDAVTVMLSPRYLLDALGVFSGDEITVGYADPHRAVSVRSDGEDAVAVIMPLRIG